MTGTVAHAGADGQRHPQSVFRRGGARRRGCRVRARDYDLVLCNSDLDRGEADAVRAIADGKARGRHPDEFRGGARAGSSRSNSPALGVPIVLLNRTAPRNAFSTVCADNEAGGVLAAEYLLKLGHRKIAHLTGPRHHGNMTERAQGFVRPSGRGAQAGASRSCCTARTISGRRGAGAEAAGAASGRHGGIRRPAT